MENEYDDDSIRCLINLTMCNKIINNSKEKKRK